MVPDALQAACACCKASRLGASLCEYEFGSRSKAPGSICFSTTIKLKNTIQRKVTNRKRRWPCSPIGEDGRKRLMSKGTLFTNICAFFLPCYSSLTSEIMPEIFALPTYRSAWRESTSKIAIGGEKASHAAVVRLMFEFGSWMWNHSRGKCGRLVVPVNGTTTSTWRQRDVLVVAHVTTNAPSFRFTCFEHH